MVKSSVENRLGVFSCVLCRIYIVSEYPPLMLYLSGPRGVDGPREMSLLAAAAATYMMKLSEA